MIHINLLISIWKSTTFNISAINSKYQNTRPQSISTSAALEMNQRENHLNIILLNLKVLPLRLCQRGGGRLQWMFSKCGHKQSQSVFRSLSLTAEVTTVIIQPTTFHISQNQKPILLLAGCERLRRLLDKIFLWELSNKNPNFQEINKRDFFQWKELITDPHWHEYEVNSVKNSQDVISHLSHLPSPSPPSWERREGPAGGRWESDSLTGASSIEF